MYTENKNNFGTVAQDKGYVKTCEDGMKCKEKQVFVDPITGDKTTQVIKTKVERRDSRSSSSSSSNSGRDGGIKKTKHSYNRKMKNTPQGTQVVVEEKRREGGVMQNIKNKINNMLHR